MASSDKRSSTTGISGHESTRVRRSLLPAVLFGATMANQAPNLDRKTVTYRPFFIVMKTLIRVVKNSVDALKKGREI